MEKKSHTDVKHLVFKFDIKSFKSGRINRIHKSFQFELDRSGFDYHILSFSNKQSENIIQEHTNVNCKTILEHRDK